MIEVLVLTVVGVTSILLLMPIGETTSHSISQQSDSISSMVFLTQRNISLPSDYQKLSLPKDIVEELKRRVNPHTLLTLNTSRYFLTDDVYLGPHIDDLIKTPIDIIPVPLSQEEVMALDDYSKKSTKSRQILETTFKIESQTLLEFTTPVSRQELSREKWLRRFDLFGKSPNPESSTRSSKSSTKLFLATSREPAPSSFRKLKLPEAFMAAFRLYIPKQKLVDAGVTTEELTAAYLASTGKFNSSGFFGISISDKVVKTLENFAM